MGQEGIAAVEDMSHGIDLMRLQLYFRVHTGENDMAPVILPGPDAVHFLVVLFDKGLPPSGILPNPVPESVFEGLLFLLGQGSFLTVQNTPLIAIQVRLIVIDTDIPEVQRVLQYLIGVSPSGAEGGVGGNVMVVYGPFSGDLPLRSHR